MAPCRQRATPEADAAGAVHGPIVRKPYRLFKLAEEIKRVLEQAEAGTATARAAERQALYAFDSARVETAQYREDAVALRAAVDRAGRPDAWRRSGAGAGDRQADRRSARASTIRQLDRRRRILLLRGGSARGRVGPRACTGPGALSRVG